MSNVGLTSEAVDAVRTSSTGRSGADGPEAEYPRVGRFILSGEDPLLLRYAACNLLVPHGLRQTSVVRGLGALPAAFTPRALERIAAACLPGPESDAAGAIHARISAELDRVPDLLHGTRWAGSRITRWIALPDARRRQLLLFLFDADFPTPFAVLKSRPTAGSPSALRNEGEALLWLAAAAPVLRGTIPEVIASSFGEERDLLLLSVLPGRSADAELRSGWLPRRRIEEHFRRAATWLTAFHKATRDLPAASRGIQAPASHGDFWARNLLLDSAQAVTSVVDWEGFRPSAPCYEDLFHFPISYGLAHGPAHQDGSRLVHAFERVFLTPGPIAGAVRRYLAHYSEATLTRFTTLRLLMEAYLAGQAATSAMAAHAADPPRRAARRTLGSPEEWRECQALLATAPRIPALP